MSKYTITMQEYADSVYAQEIFESSHIFPEPGFQVPQEDIMRICRKLFPNEYPFYVKVNDPDFPTLRGEFEDNFIRTFFTSEIGFETIGLFKFKLEAFLHTRMPYYEQLYASKFKSFEDALKGSRITTTEGITGKATSESSGNSVSTESNIPLNSGNVTPEFEDLNRNKADVSGKTSGTTQSDREKTVDGFSNVNQTTRMAEYRKLIFSINELIYKDARANHLFFQLWM